MPEQQLFGRVQLFTDESVPGAVIRLAEANHVPALSWLYDLATGITNKNYHVLSDLVADRTALEHITALASWDTQALAGRAWSPHATTSEPYAHFEGMVLPRDSIMTHRGQFCPACLREAAYWRTDWDLAHVVACARHHTWLVDTCPNCQRPVSLSRTTLCHCRECGTDYRSATAADASSVVLDVTEDIASLAPIRLGYPGHLYVESYETLFFLIRLLATQNEDLWSDRKVALDFSTRPLHERRFGVEQLANCREGFSYRADKILGLLGQVFEHLDVIRKAHVVRGRIEQLLAGSHLLAPTQRIILYGNPEPLMPSAVGRLNGDLPRCRDLRQAAHYLGIDPTECSSLVRRHLLTLPSPDEGFDADELLAARDFLDSLLCTQELDQLTGISGLGPELVRARLLTQWRFPEGAPPRYMLESVVALQDRLRLAVRVRRGCTNVISLGEILTKRRLDVGTAATILAQVAGLGVSPVSWRTPWRFADLCFEATDETLRRFQDETVSATDVHTPYDELSLASSNQQSDGRNWGS